MSEIKEDSTGDGASQLEDFSMASTKQTEEEPKTDEESQIQEKSLQAAAEQTPAEEQETPEKPQDADLIQLEVSEETEGKEMAGPPTEENSTAESKGWKPGSRCRVVYSHDGLIYPAVVEWIEGQRCCVRYDGYDNLEEHDVSSLLLPNELHTGPGPRGRERPWTRKQAKKETKKKKNEDAEAPAYHSFPFFPPFAPLDSASAPLAPPPPVWPFGKEDVSGLTCMLMQWYMCGFHTGSYMTQQMHKFSMKDEEKNPQ